MGLYAKKGKKVEAVVMDLSKAFDTLSDNFFLCKLKAYGFDVNALTLIQNKFSNRETKKKKIISLANGEKSNRYASRLYPVLPTFQHFY